MSVEVKVPSLGESVSEATIARWTKQSGEYVEIDELLVELETDKVTLEVNAPSSGVLKEIKVDEGGVVEVGALIGLIAEGGEKPAASAPAEAPKQESTNVTPISEAPASTAGAGTLSPAARKLANENKIAPEAVQGSGKDGRVTKGDMLDAIAGGGATAPKAAVSNEPREERVKMTRLRQRIAERLKDSQNTAAILTTYNEVDMGAVMNLRKEYKEIFEKKYGIKLGFMSFFIKAAIMALKEIPAVNAEIDGDEIVYKNHYDIGVAVGTPQGLVVPVLRDADALSFSEIEQGIVNYGKKARDGKLSMEEMTGGTFTISNGGVYGSLLSSPIINPPQSGILGMHKIQERPMVVNGNIEVRPMMYLALSYDHRIIDGREAVTFLVRVKECIEDPQRLLLEM